MTSTSTVMSHTVVSLLAAFTGVACATIEEPVLITVDEFNVNGLSGGSWLGGGNNFSGGGGDYAGGGANWSGGGAHW